MRGRGLRGRSCSKSIIEVAEVIIRRLALFKIIKVVPKALVLCFVAVVVGVVFF